MNGRWTSRTPLAAAGVLGALALLVATLHPGLTPLLDDPPEEDGPGALSFAKPSRVTLDGNTVYVDGEAMPILRCVVYQPVPVGVSAAYGYRWAHFPENYEGDLPLLQGLGANVLAVYARSAAEPEDLHRFMSMALERDLRVILIVDGPNHQNATNPAVQRAFLESVAGTVRAYKSHPALLFWQLGNEVDYDYPDRERVVEWYALLERAANLTRTLDPNHPVLTSNNPVTKPEAFAEGSPSVDVYGLNFYGLSEGTMRNYLSHVAKRVPGHPVLVTEFGADALDTRNDREDEETQARVIVDAWRGIESAREDGKPVLGGCVHEWLDQWWKATRLNRHDPGPEWEPGEKGVLPDDAFSVEWYGLVENVPDTTERRLRQAYHRLASEWGGAGAGGGTA